MVKGSNANTKFFHLRASCRKSANNISQLSDGTATLSSQSAIANHLFSYFRNMIGSVQLSSSTIDFSTIYGIEMVNLSLLHVPFSVDEVKSAIFACAPDKAPGPDGFPLLFYRSFWSVLQNDVMDIFNAFHNGSTDLSGINTAGFAPFPRNPTCCSRLTFALSAWLIDKAVSTDILPAVGIGEVKIHSLQFADDVLLFFDGSVRSATIISPLQAFPLSYLGLLLSLKALCRADYLPIIEKIDKRLAAGSVQLSPEEAVLSS
uniref:Reverse transcriptase domain-containing protein n=1 Tax=Ananas comosus var. bracteatus TaxID=296719 RepID=A0A6V7NQJ4_ANACO|nr:unnamed protein product [Ananas comosus var. bracteatus]